ncbi:aminotransferase class I/II-fold pyridoxal phosphate-dependent enzyme [Lactobacillus sp. Sy-1]|uniref:aminotransferase class I/II-fold pyridoxal phosphate-dependent enzyme n=1 Tax=Lactobacillus sp. Sy-1 TaxID=2109645 RepID=UPI001C5BAD35|nr:aminotransferase class I/II-fold pyridoxal phosphate-dependent enzyme [Lactobacillus sp. Sy-1]MBW1606180.1 aminotransferase class I/II-fold pyridoxal phosphate-dependent enzyme [Lactobacillus sp. Sy-1]
MDLKQLISKNANKIQPDVISSFNSQVAGIKDLIPLTLGEPDFNTPEHIKEAAVQAIRRNESHYTDPQGIPELREAATSYVHDKYGLDYDPKTEVLATAGVSEALLCTFLAIIDPGDEVIIPTPGFPVYEGSVTVPGGKPVFIDTSDNGFKLDPNKLKQVLDEHGDSVKALVLNYPSNPTGVTYNEAELRALADVIKDYDVLVISDEIYSELTYDHNHFSFARLLPDQTITYNGLSKSHAMTGWRVGLVFAKPAILSEIFKMHMFASFSITTNAQYAAVEALNNGRNDAQPMKKVYEERRDLVASGLKAVGLDSPKPEGAFYIFASLPESYKNDSMKFCIDLANEAHVGVVPGVGFGPGGENSFRISYAASTESLKEAVKRIQEFVKNHE